MNQTKLTSVELPATDLQATKHFYARYFGWEWTDYGPTYAGSSTSGIEVGVTTEAEAAPTPAPQSHSAVGPLVLLQADAIAPVHQEMADAGEDIVTAPFEFPGGRRFHVADPGGNVIGIFEYDN